MANEPTITNSGQHIYKPRDGPATVFEADPMVTDIFTCQDGDYFGLVLVSNWPVSPFSDMDKPYQKFLTAIKSCFQEKDTLPSTNNPASLPAVYTYPTIYLHITLATLIHPTKLDGSHELSSESVREAKKKEAMELVRSASKLPGWPKEPLRLMVDSAQIGKRAGILLWKDLSGGVAAIRDCLRAASAETDTGTKRTIFPKIPGIIHSTFLRFSEVPKTPGEDVQEAFRSKGLGTPSKEFFCTSGEGGGDNGDSTKESTNKSSPLLLRAETVRLVSETTPYMHLPNNDQHVPWSIELTE